MSHKIKAEILRELEIGYKETAEINLKLAEEALEADNENLSRYEEKLTECE